MHSKTDPPLDLGHIEHRVSETERRLDALENAYPLAQWRPLVETWATEHERFAFQDLCQALQVPPVASLRRGIGELLRATGYRSYRSRGRQYFKRV
jgi:hypothetical protein